MSKTAPDWEIWLYIILYLAFLGGLLYLTKFITPLPYILLIVTTLISYLIRKEKLTAINPKDASSMIVMLWLIIVVAGIAFLAKPHRYDSYIGKYIVSGKMVTKTVTVEADEGPNTWEEKRTYWEPKTKSGKFIMGIISWFNIGLIVGLSLLCFRFYIKTKEREERLKKKSGFLPDYS